MFFVLNEAHKIIKERELEKLQIDFATSAEEQGASLVKKCKRKTMKLKV